MQTKLLFNMYLYENDQTTIENHSAIIIFVRNSEVVWEVQIYGFDELHSDSLFTRVKVKVLILQGQKNE